MANERQKISVVTGAAGFMGSHLCDFLLDIGHRVIGLAKWKRARLACRPQVGLQLQGSYPLAVGEILPLTYAACERAGAHRL